jgi:hypothetical protein
MITLKQALMSGFFGEKLWLARHPKTGKRLAVMSFSGTWYECPHWMGVVRGLDPKYILEIEFLKRHSYTALGVVYWEIPDGPIYLKVGEKGVPGSAHTFFIGSDDRITSVDALEPVSLFKALASTTTL